MKRLVMASCVLVGAAIVTLVGCGEGSEGDQGTHPFLKARFTGEMKAVLHDLQMAQEQAAINEGRYMELRELEVQYFSRPVREGMELTVVGVTPSSYRAKLVHKPSGITCRLEVAEVGARGLPVCD